MNEQEVLKYAQETMRCATCKHLKNDKDIEAFDSFCDEISKRLFFYDDTLGINDNADTFGCIYWEEKDDQES